MSVFTPLEREQLIKQMRERQRYASGRRTAHAQQLEILRSLQALKAKREQEQEPPATSPFQISPEVEQRFKELQRESRRLQRTRPTPPGVEGQYRIGLVPRPATRTTTTTTTTTVPSILKQQTLASLEGIRASLLAERKRGHEERRMLYTPPYTPAMVIREHERESERTEEKHELKYFPRRSWEWFHRHYLNRQPLTRDALISIYNYYPDPVTEPDKFEQRIVKVLESEERAVQERKALQSILLLCTPPEMPTSARLTPPTTTTITTPAAAAAAATSTTATTDTPMVPMGTTPEWSPPVLCILDSWQLPDGRFYLTFAYDPQWVLFAHWTPRNVDEWIRVRNNLVQALSLLHEPPLRIVHRDIKPFNLLVNPRTLQIRLIDFGFACPVETCAHSGYAGTTEYMSPLDLRDGRQRRQSSVWRSKTGREDQILFDTDMWSLGVSLMEKLIALLGDDLRDATKDVRSWTSSARWRDAVRAALLSPSASPAVIAEMTEAQHRSYPTFQDSLANLQKYVADVVNGITPEQWYAINNRLGLPLLLQLLIYKPLLEPATSNVKDLIEEPIAAAATATSTFTPTTTTTPTPLSLA